MHCCVWEYTFATCGITVLQTLGCSLPQQVLLLRSIRGWDRSAVFLGGPQLCPTLSLSAGQLGAFSSWPVNKATMDIFCGSPSVLAWKLLRHRYLGWDDGSDWLTSYGSTKFFFQLVIEPPGWGAGGGAHFSLSSPALVAVLFSHFFLPVCWIESGGGFHCPFI